MTEVNHFESRARALFEESIDVKRRTIAEGAPTIVEMAKVIFEAFRNGHRLLLCGNGGSAADAQHLAAELLVRLRPTVDRDPLPALTLAFDTSSMTAHGNDYEFAGYYARMVEAIGRPGDVLMAITTSGRSPNIINALGKARSMGLATLGLLGSGGGEAATLCDVALVVPSNVTGRIQEAHITAGHSILELVEDLWTAEK
jgi:D-sedoheptulose 7-phosphate isomerase